MFLPHTPFPLRSHLAGNWCGLDPDGGNASNAQALVSVLQQQGIDTAAAAAAAKTWSATATSQPQ